LEFNSEDVNDNRIDYIENLTNVKGKIKYLNIPSSNTDISKYFTEDSELPYNKLIEIKRKLDPDNIFVTRNPLI
jgi:hypothetical protein